MTMPNETVDTTIPAPNPVTEMIAPLPQYQWTPDMTELVTVGNEKAISLKAKRVGESLTQVAEALREMFGNAQNVYAFSITNLPFKLEPDDRRDVREFLEAHIPLGDVGYRWDVRWAGREDGFELRIAKRITRERK